MKLVREGIPFVTLPALLSAAAVLSGHPNAALAFLVASGLALFFFRDPRRTLPASRRAVVSPADGTIRGITPIPADPELGGPFRRIWIHLNLWDVHVNRVPFAGQILSVRYSPGRFLPAFLRRATLENERNRILIHSPGLTLAVEQIAGALARRIVCYRRPGEWVERGEKLGFIRFGSGVLLDLPEAIRLQVRVGQRVRAGETIVALLPERV